MSPFSAMAFGKASLPTCPWPAMTTPPLIERRKACPWYTAGARGRAPSSRHHHILKTSLRTDTIVYTQNNKGWNYHLGSGGNRWFPGPWGATHLPEAKRRHMGTWTHIFSVHIMTKGTPPQCLISTKTSGNVESRRDGATFPKSRAYVCVLIVFVGKIKTLSHKKGHKTVQRTIQMVTLWAHQR